MNGLIGTVVSGFEPIVEAEGRAGTMVEQAVGERAANALVKEDEEKGHASSFVGQAIGVAIRVAFEESVGFQLAQVVAELAEAIGVGGQAKGLEDGGVQIGGAPAGYRRGLVQEQFQQTDEAGVVDLDARDAGGSTLQRSGQSLEKLEIEVRSNNWPATWRNDR